MTYQERQQLNTLSAQVFGSSSRWKKIVDNGTVDRLSRDREVLVPGSNGPVTKVFTDTKDVIRRYSVEEVRELMQGILNQRNALVHKAADEVEVTSSAPSVQLNGSDNLLGFTVTGPGIPDGAVVARVQPENG